MSFMVRCKNAGGPGNDKRRPPRLTMEQKEKGPKKVLAKKKHKRGDIEAERATIVAASKCAERGGRGSGVHIDEVQFHLEGRELGTDERSLFGFGN